MLQQALKQPSTIQLHFRVATTAQMRELGSALAELISIENIGFERVATIGIMADFDFGKTHLSKGLIETFTPTSIEQLNREPFIQQTRDNGTIIHFDYLDSPEFDPNLYTDEQTTIIVEHAEESTLDIDYWIEGTINSDNTRDVMIEIPADEMDDPHVAAFLQKAQKFTI